MSINVAEKRLATKVIKESLVCLSSLKRTVIVRLYIIGLWTIRTNVVIAKLYTAKMFSRGFINPKTEYIEEMSVVNLEQLEAGPKLI